MQLLKQALKMLWNDNTVLKNDTQIVKSLIVLSVIVNNSDVTATSNILIADTISFKNCKNTQLSENVQKLWVSTEADSHIEWKLTLSVTKMQSEHDFESLSDNKLIIKESQPSQS